MANEQTRTSRRKASPPQKKGTKSSSGNGSGKQKNGKNLIVKILLGLVFIGCILFLSGVGLFWFYADRKSVV